MDQLTRQRVVRAVVPYLVLVAALVALRAQLVTELGADYEIAVDGNNLGFGAPSGGITLKVLLIPTPDPPPNDDLINAIPLAGSSVSVEVRRHSAHLRVHLAAPGSGWVWQ